MSPARRPRDRRTRADQIRALHEALCRLWLQYSAAKPRIRADSYWFERDHVYASWLRTDDDQITLALATGTPLRPTERTNRLWVEEHIAQTLELSLAASVQQNVGGDAYWLAVSMAGLARGLASGLDVDAALLVLNGVADAAADPTTAPATLSLAAIRNPLGSPVDPGRSGPRGRATGPGHP